MARIVSFESLAWPAALWRAVFAGDDRARLVEAAIGPEPGEATIHLSARDDSSSLLPITARQNALFPGTAEARTAHRHCSRILVGRISRRRIRRHTPPTGHLARTNAGCTGLAAGLSGLHLDVQGFCCCVGGPPPGRWVGARHRHRSRRGAAPTGLGCGIRGRSRRGRRSYRSACRRPAPGPMG